MAQRASFRIKIPSEGNVQMAVTGPISLRSFQDIAAEIIPKLQKILMDEVQAAQKAAEDHRRARQQQAKERRKALRDAVVVKEVLGKEL